MNYFKNLKIDGYEIQETELLGIGQSGKVYACKSLKQNEQNLSLCIKLMEVKDQKRANREAEILNHIKDKHPNNKNLVKILEVKIINVDNEQLMAIVMERCYTDLKKICAEKKVHTNEEVVDFLQQLLKGYQPLYDGSFVHRDIRPDHIMVNYENGKPIYKLAGFVTAKKMDKKENIMFQTASTGAPAYASPEMNKLAPEDPNLIQDSQNCKEINAVDIFSIGIILWQLLYGNFPFETTSVGIQTFFSNLQSSGTVKTPFNPNVDKDLAQLIEKMIVYLPSKRITFKEVVTLFGKKEPNINLKPPIIQPQFQPRNFNGQNQFQMPQPLIGINQQRAQNNNAPQANFQPINFQPFPLTGVPKPLNRILINPQQPQQQNSSLDFLCPYHSEKILFLNLNSGVSKGNRTLCVRCQLIYPTNLDVAIQQWGQYKVVQRQKVEDTYTQILNPIKETKKQLTTILEAITTLESQIIQQKQQDIQLIEEYDRNITISKLQDIAEVVAEQQSLTKNDYLQTFIQKLGVVEKNLTFELKNYENVMNSMRQESDILVKKQQALDLLQKGRNLKEINQYDKALELLNQSPISMHELHNEIGLILQIQNRHQQAIEFFDKALVLDPQSAQYHKNKGDSLVALGQLIQGKQCYEQALKLNPNYLEAQQAIQRQ